MKRLTAYLIMSLFALPVFAQQPARPAPTTPTSLLSSAGVNQTIIKRIAGHSGAMNLTEKVYIHFDIQELVDAINLI